MEKLYSCRKCTVCCLFVLLVILSTEAVTKIQLNYEEGDFITYDYKKPLVLQCNVTGDDKEAPAVRWLRNGAELVGERFSIETHGKDKTLTIAAATDADAGNYTCKAGDISADITAVLKPLVKVPAHSSVVEGDTLTITCIVFGYPVPNIMWTIGNTTYNDSADRIKLLQGKESKVPKAILQIEDANMADRENYTCIAETRVGNTYYNHSSTTFLRVKDKMAALWPFIGICIEVIVLCTVILVYEKKRNKTEMEESDTDGSPEQKNTPDHGKDSEVRHRK